MNMNLDEEVCEPKYFNITDGQSECN